MTLLMKSADFALQVYNKTHSLAFSLMELVRATGDDSRVDLLYRAKSNDPLWPRRREDPDSKIFRARVFVTLNYVEFVRPDDMTSCYGSNTRSNNCPGFGATYPAL
ncbi:hypothetical protein MIMGU_mgv1a016827mg [Erythranthe guttata]|uniref:Uncharacterized protein n=1 Tax=Erythranthe guttata TaxID=4155 RepID=A0A022QBG9_ERYGU|nr:hypothetical protein MIMGU_mgv1a016827mg [Erythranthe guttata]